MKTLKLSTKPNIIKTKNIETLEFRLIFPIKTDYDKNYYITYLRLILTTSSKKYPDQTILKKEKLKRLLLNYNFYFNTIIDNTYLVFSFSTPKENLVSDFDLEEAFKFAIDLLMNPLIENEEFNHEKFYYEKEYLLKNNERALTGIYAKNNNSFFERIDPDDELGNTHEKNTKILNETNPKDLYNFYKESIIDNNFISYVYGDVDEDKINYLFSKYLPQKKDTISLDINYFKCMKMSKYNYHEEITNFNQSELFMEYQVENLKESEKIYLYTIVNFLNASENNLIFESLRVKNNLVYDVKVTSFISRGMFIINSFIPSDKREVATDLINEVFETLHDKKFLSECLKKLAKGLEVDLLKEEDSLVNELEYRINEDLEISTIKSTYEEIKKVKVSDLIEFLDRIKLTNVVFFKGDAND